MKVVKPKLVYRSRGYWDIDNWIECLQSTTLNSKERQWIHLALAWVKWMNKK